MCNWKSKYFPHYVCNEPALEGDRDGLCILHSTREDKDPNAFKEKVQERLAGKDKIDLRGCYFPKGFPCEYIGHNFAVPVDFSEATFSEGAYFTGATFSKGAYFREAIFSKGADFRWAIFSKEVYFTGATFSWGANFSSAKFREMVRFQSWESGDERRPVLLGPGSSFQYTRFPGEVVFQDVDLSHCSFLHSNIDKVDFRYCKFVEKDEWLFGIFPHHRQNVLRDELEVDELLEGSQDSMGHSERSEESRPFANAQGDILEPSFRKNKYEPVRRLYLELKRNFEDKKDWNTAGDFHYGEMECRRKKYGWLGRNLFSLEALYYGASGYGERPLRALSWWFFSTLLFFPLLYRLSEHDPLSACVWDSVRVATFMKIGIPIEPESWGRIVLTLQYFICPTLLALLALALRRKVKR